MNPTRTIRSSWQERAAAALLIAGPAVFAGPASAGTPDFVEHQIDDMAFLYSVSTVDLDLDGDMDIVASGSGASGTPTGGIFWYENDGASPPGFTRRTIRAQSWGLNFHAADIDGDGDIDVASATGDIFPCSGDISQLAWSENDGDDPPSWTQHTIEAACIDWRDVFVADINGDGHQDVLTGTTINPDQLSWYENDGSSPPAFTQRIIRAENVDFWGLCAEDLDDDDDLDVICGIGGAFVGVLGEIDWYENGGGFEPIFTERLVDRLDSYDRAAATAFDLDADGDQDVIGRWFDSRQVIWYQSDGGSPPSFTPHFVDSSTSSPLNTAVGDVDRDGDIDLLIAWWGGSDVLAWYESDGTAPPGFTKHAIPITLNGVHADLGDLDGDGDPDIVAAEYSASRLNWYENLQVAPPPNDRCEDRIALEVPSVTTGTTLDATFESAELFCDTMQSAPGVWYSVTGTGTTITATTCGDFFDYDTQITVFCGTCDDPVCVINNDDDCDGFDDLLSTVTWCGELGTEYLILVHGWYEVGNFELALSEDGVACEPPPCDGPPAPANDLCENRIPLEIPSTTAGTTVNARFDEGLPGCETPVEAPGVWYSVRGTGSTLTATTCGDFFDYDTQITVFCGACDDPTCIGGNDDDCDLQSTVSWCSQAGAEYLILVHGFFEVGDFELSISEDGVPCDASIECPVTTCPADIDGNGNVNMVDMLIVLAMWGECPPNCYGDLNGDLVVDVLDLLFVLNQWGDCS